MHLNLAAPVLLALLLAPAWAPAIEAGQRLSEMHHAVYTARDGAPKSVLAFAQTEDGFLWLGGQDGLHRFDGVRFEAFTVPSEPSLTANVRALLALPGNGLLVGTVFEGVWLLRDGRVTKYRAAEGYPAGTTQQFATEPDGTIWAALNSGLARFDGAQWARVDEKWGFNDKAVRSVVVTRDGTLVVLGVGSLYFLPQGARSFESRKLVEPAWDLALAPNGAIYLGVDGGVRILRDLRAPELPRLNIALPKIPSIMVDRDGGLWLIEHRVLRHVGSPEKAIPTIEPMRKDEGLSGIQGISMFEDRERNVWVSTALGLDRFRYARFSSTEADLLAPSMLAAPDGAIWLDRRGDVVLLRDKSGGVRRQTLRNVTCMYRDRGGVAWFGAAGVDQGPAGLIRYDGKSFEQVAMPRDLAPDRQIQALAVGGDGALWMSVVRQGIFRRAKGEWIQPPELPGSGKQAALSIMADSLGRIWLGYPNNRVVLWQDGNARVFSSSDGLEIGNPLAFVEDGPRVWAAGEQGVFVFESQRFRGLSLVDAAVLRGISGIARLSNGDLWLHGQTGALLVASAEVERAITTPDHRMAYRLFAEDDGLVGSPNRVRPLPTLVQGTDGRLWFATWEGAFWVDPSKIGTNTVAPDVTIMAVSADGKRYTSQSTLNLKPLTRDLQIDYTATNLAKPQRVQFRYRLEGFESEWRDAGARRQAFYTNLGPGAYRFQVIAANEDGVWSKAGVALPITIAPAWFQTAWFMALCALAVFALLALLYKLRIAQVRMRIHARLQERIIERERIARELHDTFLQAVQGLVLKFQAVKKRIPEKEPASEMLEEALKEADQVIAEGRDRVRELRDTQELAEDLPGALSQAARAMAKSDATVFEVVSQGQVRPLHRVVHDEMLRIASEAIRNAFMHSQAKRVEVEVDYGKRVVRLRVRDNGKGMDPEILEAGGVEGHWGISGMRERARRIGARLEVWSRKGSGTEVELVVPASSANGRRSRDEP